MEYEILTLMPILVVIVMSLVTKRILESLIIGTWITYIIVDGTGFAQGWMDAFFSVASNRDHQWVLMVCALFGSLIALLGASHGTLGFSKWLGKLCRGPKSTMLVTWIMGILIFVDDYLNINWNCQEKCSRINSLNSFSIYAARSPSCSVRYTAAV